MIIGAFSRVHAMPHQQDVAHIVPVCSGGSMIVVMMDANGDPIKRQVTCPDCISVLALLMLQWVWWFYRMPMCRSINIGPIRPNARQWCLMVFSKGVHPSTLDFKTNTKKIRR
jgi:hypothetical protein